MDSLITAAARALAGGDLVGVLKRVGLRDDAPALALRGIAMAQLGDFMRAKPLLRKAALAFGAKEPVARARCIVAEAEIALVSRDLNWPTRSLKSARVTLERHGDRVNAAHARHLEIRRLLLIGRLDEAEQALAGLDALPLPPSSRAAHALIAAGLAIRRLRIDPAQAALLRARRAAGEAGIPGLMAEVERAFLVLSSPAARLVARGEDRVLLLGEVEAVLSSGALVVDGCRHVVRGQGARGQGARSTTESVSLVRRPVLFALVRALAEAWPGDVSREVLVRRVFRGGHADESHRARLRVEIGRLRAELRPLASLRATKRGFALVARGTSPVVVLAPPIEDDNAAMLALLADGEAWSSSALALALGASARTVQRGLDMLATAGKVRPYGHGRARRWMTAMAPAFTTHLLLPGPLPSD